MIKIKLSWTVLLSVLLLISISINYLLFKENEKNRKYKALTDYYLRYETLKLNKSKQLQIEIQKVEKLSRKQLYQKL